MNIEGGGSEHSFITTKKVVVLIILLIISVLIISALASANATFGGYATAIGLMLFIYQFIIRYFIFEEKYYYKIYKKTKLYKNPTPAIFWDIASFRDTEEGSIIIYSDMKVGVLVKLERDTIIGKDDDFRETHYDALSDFYRELSIRNLNLIQLNLMEQAGKDNRLNYLNKIITECDNENIRKLLELQLGYIKTITRETLYESDYVLIYSNKPDAIDYIINEAVESLYHLLDGAYNRFEIMHSRDIKEMVKDLYCVNYFDYNEAIMNLFKQSGLVIPKAFDIAEIKLNSGESIKVGEREKLLLQNLASCVEKGSLTIGDLTIKNALEGKFDVKIKEVMSERSTEYSDKDIRNSQGTPDDIIIDLDNEAFGGEFGVGMNSVKSDRQ